MSHDEEDFENKRKFSVVQECPRCGQLSIVFRKGEIICENCGYNEDIPTIR